MSRFTGWSAKDIARLSVVKQSGNVDVEKEKKVRETYPKRRETGKSKSSPDYVGMISSALTMLGIAHEREYKFLHDRRFRFDLAVPKHLIALEWEGGIFSGGRHVRGKGYANDAKKYNLATRHGWKLLRYTTEDTKELNWEFRVADEIKKLIGE